MNILNKIVADKKVEVIQKKKLLPISYLEKSPLFDRHCNSLVKKIKINDFGIIAEFKRRSPSKKILIVHFL